MMNSRYPAIAPLNAAALFPIGEESYAGCFSAGYPSNAALLNGLHLSSDSNLMGSQVGSSPPIHMDMNFDMSMDMSMEMSMNYMNMDPKFNQMRRNSEMALPQYAPTNNRRHSEMCLPSPYPMSTSPSTQDFPIISHKPTPRALKAKRCPTNKCPCGGKDDCMEPGCIKSAGHYVCPVCSIEFSRKNSMRRHVLTHINLRPYECQACQKSFYRSDIYKRHLSSKKCRRNLHVPQQTMQFNHQPNYQDLSSYLNHHIPQL